MVEFPWSELYPKIVTSLTGSDATFDLVSFAPAWLPDFVSYLSEMPKEMQSGKDWDDVEPAYRERLMVWEGKIYSQSMDGDVHTYTYRTDLLSDPKEKDAFKAKYGYDLAPPKTWKQYLDIAEFFQRPDKGLWGTAEAFRRGGQQFWFFFSHAAAYTNNPNYPGAMFFDPETMDAQINNPGWVKGLEEYIRASKLGPPNALNFSFGEVNAAVAGGQVAESIGWGDTGVIAADPKQSKISGKVGSAILPGSDEIWNAKTKKWDKFGNVLPTPFMAFGGWQIAVPKVGKNLQAAWDFVKTLTSPEVSGQAAITGGSGVNPLSQIAHRQSAAVEQELLAGRGQGISRCSGELDQCQACRARHASVRLFLQHRSCGDRAWQGAGRPDHAADRAGRGREGMESPDRRVRPREATGGLSRGDGSPAQELASCGDCPG